MEGSRTRPPLKPSLRAKFHIAFTVGGSGIVRVQDRALCAFPFALSQGIAHPLRLIRPAGLGSGVLERPWKSSCPKDPQPV